MASVAVLSTPYKRPPSAGGSPSPRVPKGLSSSSSRVSSQSATPSREPVEQTQGLERWEHPQVSNFLKGRSNATLWLALDRERLVWNGVLLGTTALSHYVFRLQDILAFDVPGSSRSTTKLVQGIHVILALLSLFNILWLSLKYLIREDLKDVLPSPAKGGTPGVPRSPRRTPTPRKETPSRVSPSPFSNRSSPRQLRESPSRTYHKSHFMSSSSPLARRSFSITEPAQIETLINNSSLGETLRRPLDASKTNTSGASMMVPTSPIQKYQPALKPAISPAVVEQIEDGFLYKSPQVTLSEWGIAPYVDLWSESLRKWLVTHVIGPLVERIDKVDAAFKEGDMAHLDCSSMTFAEGLGSALPSYSGRTTINSSGKPQTLLELNQSFPNDPMVLERLALERQLTFPDYQCRSYIVARIKALSKGYCLAQFRWNGGQSWEGRVWSHEEFPTDSQIIITSFMHYLDELLRQSENRDSFTIFSSQYFLPIGAKPDVMSKRVQVRQGSKWPPHYQIRSDTTIYDLFSGRNNAFQTLSLFILITQKVAGGYLGNLDLGSKEIDLLSTLSKS